MPGANHCKIFRRAVLLLRMAYKVALLSQITAKVPLDFLEFVSKDFVAYWMTLTVIYFDRTRKEITFIMSLQNKYDQFPVW